MLSFTRKHTFLVSWLKLWLRERSARGRARLVVVFRASLCRVVARGAPRISTWRLSDTLNRCRSSGREICSYKWSAME